MNYDGDCRTAPATPGLLKRTRAVFGGRNSVLTMFGQKQHLDTILRKKQHLSTLFGGRSSVLTLFEDCPSEDCARTRTSFPGSVSGMDR